MNKWVERACVFLYPLRRQSALHTSSAKMIKPETMGKLREMKTSLAVYLHTATPLTCIDQVERYLEMTVIY